MKKFLAVMLAAVVVCTSAFAMGGCNTVEVEVNSEMTQLYIGNYNGGVGEKWLDEAIIRFEKLHEKTEFEPGKEGAQIIVDHNKAYDGISLPNSIATDETYEVYFSGGASYLDFVGLNVLQDITDLVTKKTYDDEGGVTIADKMYPDMLEGMTINGKIYGLPHYELYDGPSYDANLFEENALFFIEEIDTNDTKYPGTKKFMASKTHAATRSCGPDGILGTYDDGLPSTVQEFYKLLEKMEQKAVKPFIWTGDSPHYSNQILRRLFANLGGAAILNANYHMDSMGEEIEIVTGFDKNGNPQLDKVVITKDNAYLLRQASALYYVLEFAQKVRSNDKFIEDDGLSLDHISTQEAYVNSGKNFNGKDPVAMIIDGSWWYNEANDDGIFERFAEYPDAAQKEFKYMPLPVKYAGTVKEGEGSAPVVAGGASAYMLVNKNIKPNKIKLMEEFIHFLYSQDELLEFTKITNGVLRPLNYNYSTVFSSLSSFAQSSLEILEAAKDAGTYIVTFTADKTFLKYKAAMSISGNDWLSGNMVRFPIHEYSTKTTLADVRTQFNSFKIDAASWQP